VLYARRDVHGLAEVVERAVRGHHVAGPGIETELQPHEVPVLGFRTELLEPRECLDRRARALTRVHERRHQRVPHGLDEHSVVRFDSGLENVEMIVDQAECGGVAHVRVGP